mmetsp:Transcript_17024/g.34490  ORF Transcript_17024/g.34490 Transcript_17024/m.34490 type:complete len:204 (-) Transcript_17024:167-778(-)
MAPAGVGYRPTRPPSCSSAAACDWASAVRYSSTRALRRRRRPSRLWSRRTTRLASPLCCRAHLSRTRWSATECSPRRSTSTTRAGLPPRWTRPTGLRPRRAARRQRRSPTTTSVTCCCPSSASRRRLWRRMRTAGASEGRRSARATTTRATTTASRRRRSRWTSWGLGRTTFLAGSSCASRRWQSSRLRRRRARQKSSSDGLG